MAIHPPPANPPILAGVSDLASLCRGIVDEPGKVKKFLAAWDGYLKRYETVLEGYGGLEKIVELESAAAELEKKAAADRDAGRDEMEDAKDKARQSVAEATVEADATIEKARASIEEFEREKADFEAASKTREKELKAREAAVEKAEIGIAERTGTVVAREFAVASELEKFAAAGIRVTL